MAPLKYLLSLRQAFKDGWFTEKSTLWPGQGLSIQYDEILFQEKSDFQVRGRGMPRHQPRCIWAPCMHEEEGRAVDPLAHTHTHTHHDVCST